MIGFRPLFSGGRATAAAADPDAALGTPDIYLDFETPGDFGALGHAANKGSLSMTFDSQGTVEQSTTNPYAGAKCLEFNNGTAYFNTTLTDTSFDFDGAVIQYAVRPRTASDPSGPQVHFCWDKDLNNRCILYMTDRVPTLYVRRGGGTAVVFGTPPSAVAADAWTLWRWEIFGGNITLKIGGATVATVADPGSASGFTRALFGSTVAWGRVAFAGDSWFTGCMDEFKLWRNPVAV